MGRRCAALRLAIALAAIGLTGTLCQTAGAADPAGSPGTSILEVSNLTSNATVVSGFIWPAQISGLDYSIWYGPASSDFCQAAEAQNGDGDSDTTNYSGLTHDSTAPAWDDDQDTVFHVLLPDLAPADRYCALSAALSGSEVVVTSSPQFFTAGTPDVSLADAAVVAGPRSDRLSATVNTASSPASYSFEWAPRFSTWCASHGTEGSPQSATAVTLLAEISPVTLTGRLFGLIPGRYYCAGLSVTNPSGTTTALSFGLTQSGFMGGQPSITTGSASQVFAHSARLGYRVNTDQDPQSEVYLEWEPVADRGCRRLLSAQSTQRSLQYSDADLAPGGGVRARSLATDEFAQADPLVRLEPGTRYCYVAELASDEPNPFEQSRYFGKVRYFTTLRAAPRM